MTIAALIFMGVVAQGDRSLVDQLKIPIDPRNGYFDYLAVADNLRRKHIGWYVEAVSNPGWLQTLLAPEKPGKDSDDDTPLGREQSEFAARAIKMTPLQIRKEAMSLAREVFPILENARKKGAWDPRTKIEYETIFPEYVEFKNICKFLTTISIETHYAEGDYHAATADLLDCLRLADACGTSPTLIGALVCRANQAIAMRSLEKHLVRVSLPDCLAIDTYAKASLERPDMFARAIKSETETTVGYVDSLFAGTLKDEYISEDLRKDIEKLTPTQRVGYAERAKSLLGKKYADLIAVLSQSEKQMAEYLNTQRDPEEGGPEQDQRPIPERVADEFAFVDAQIVQSALIQKVQMRLLRAAMAVIRFRWHNEVLPIRLTDAGPVEVTNDAVTGRPFIYRNKGQEFELGGMGARSMGEIKLYYRRPAPTTSEPPPP